MVRRKKSPICCARFSLRQTMVYQKEHHWCRCVNGEGLVLLCIPESWGRLSGEPTTACCCSCCIIHDNKLAKKVFLTVCPVAASLRSQLELTMQETLVAQSSHKIHTHNSTEAGRKAGGRATIAPHKQMQFICVSFPCFNAPPTVKQAHLLHRCSAVLLLPPGPLLCTSVGKTHACMCSQQSASRDSASSSALGSRWEPHKEDENTEDTVCCLRHGELCSSWCLLYIDSGQGGIGSQ